MQTVGVILDVCVAGKRTVLSLLVFHHIFPAYVILCGPMASLFLVVMSDDSHFPAARTAVISAWLSSRTISSSSLTNCLYFKERNALHVIFLNKMYTLSMTTICGYFQRIWFQMKCVEYFKLLSSHTFCFPGTFGRWKLIHGSLTWRHG